MRGKMRRLIKVPKAKFLAPDQGKRVKVKRILSGKTGKAIKKPGVGRTVRFEYEYEDGTRYKSKAFKATKAELALFKATAEGDAHAHDPRETAPGEEKGAVIFSKCLDVPRGGRIDTARMAVAELLGAWQLPKEGMFEVLIYWKVYEDQLKENVLEAPPSKRFMVDSAELKKGYGIFLDSMLALKYGDKIDDLEELGMTLEQVREDNPGLIKQWRKELLGSPDVPKNVTRAFLEKQLLAMAQGRGVYISDKSYFKDHYNKKAKKAMKGKRAGTKEPKQNLPETAEFSEICIKVWALPKAKKRRGKK